MKILFIGIFLFGQNLLAQQNALHSNIKNESGLHIQSKDAPPRISDVIGATYCYGTLDTCLDKLKEIGISKNRLQKLVQCTVGDFDGNGYLDFSIWGIDSTKKYQDNIEWTDAENYLVLFFEKSKIIGSIKIRTTPGFNLLHYPRRLKTGPNGEPKSNNDALWICGETDDYYDTSKGTVYIFDSKSENFKTVPFGKK
jgi:hypothetical protein